MLEKHHVNVLTETSLQEVGDTYFMVKRAENIERLDFDYGFCMPWNASYAPHLSEN